MGGSEHRRKISQIPQYRKKKKKKKKNRQIPQYYNSVSKLDVIMKTATLYIKFRANNTEREI